MCVDVFGVWFVGFECCIEMCFCVCEESFSVYVGRVVVVWLDFVWNVDV